MTEQVDLGERRRGWNLLWLPLSVVWLTLLISPAVDTIREQSSPFAQAATVIGVGAYIVLYLWMGRHNVMRMPPATRGPYARWLPVPALTVLSLILTLSFGEEWLGIFIFTTAAAGIYLRPPGVAIRAIGGEIALAAVAGFIIGDQWSDIGTTLMMAGAVGLTMFLLVGVGVANRELRQAREELARMAVSEERLRFARDLHDLLGHSLSLIALKSELAGRLVAVDPGKAASEIKDVEAVARQALAEVREAVAGYRQPTLTSELRGAVELLEAAGITYHEDGTRMSVPAPAEAALAWTVREGVTNVIRHSRARRCTIRMRRDDTGIALEVVDDGKAVEAPGGSGSGLAGLAERIEAIGGRFAAGPLPDGGFRLAVWLPVDWDEPVSRDESRASMTAPVLAGAGQS